MAPAKKKAAKKRVAGSTFGDSLRGASAAKIAPPKMALAVRAGVKPGRILSWTLPSGKLGNVHPPDKVRETKKAQAAARYRAASRDNGLRGLKAFGNL